MVRMGRPKKPKSERQSHLIALRLTPAEHRKLEQAAQKSEISVSDYVRRALGFTGKQKRDAPVLLTLPKLFEILKGAAFSDQRSTFASAL